jgi:hypothetical protein
VQASSPRSDANISLLQDDYSVWGSTASNSRHSIHRTEFSIDISPIVQVNRDSTQDLGNAVPIPLHQQLLYITVSWAAKASDFHPLTRQFIMPINKDNHLHLESLLWLGVPTVKKGPSRERSSLSLVIPKSARTMVPWMLYISSIFAVVGSATFSVLGLTSVSPVIIAYDAPSIPLLAGTLDTTASLASLLLYFLRIL